MSAPTSLNYQIKQLIVRILELEVAPDEIPDDETLFGDGLAADSIVLLEIIAALEEEFGFEIDDDDLRVELFNSVDSIAAYVRVKIATKDHQSTEAANGIHLP